ncbi:hypothetical protein Nepgr_013465 [Nepenthes gracilis]|uniref:Uncharacterized protein n=1 Tax=Nepenthes gracilis TaxID=150966 RepID=A0AAD3XP56_NEPGR|nr:hypothetical protein Nepgr_013465 [Nepenthes gracilis]
MGGAASILLQRMAKGSMLSFRNCCRERCRHYVVEYCIKSCACFPSCWLEIMIVGFFTGGGSGVFHAELKQLEGLVACWICFFVMGVINLICPFSISSNLVAGLNTVKWYGIRVASLGLADVERLPLCWSCYCRFAWMGY